jgi:arylsulfatase A
VAQNKDKTLHSPPLVYHLGHDPGEKYNLAGKHPDVVKRIQDLLEKHKATIKPVENQLEK